MLSRDKHRGKSEPKSRADFDWFKAQEAWLKNHMLGPDVPEFSAMAENPFGKENPPRNLKTFVNLHGAAGLFSVATDRLMQLPILLCIPKVEEELSSD